jgi:dephospho-CoA kinase
VPEALQLARTTARDNNTPEQVQNIMRAQLDRKSRLEAADDIIVNDQSRSQLAQDVDHLHNIYEQLCQKPLV